MPARAAELGWGLGCSAPLSARELPHPDTRAERALQRARRRDTGRRPHHRSPHLPRARHPGRRPRTRPHPLRPPGQGRAARRSGPPRHPAGLAHPPRQTGTAPRRSWGSTATLRHRLARVADLLDVDLQGPGARMELWFALQWLPGEAPHERP
ncbi:helix-turn-helix domain-containing protein [Streptomyces sp. NPDC002405]